VIFDPSGDREALALAALGRSEHALLVHVKGVEADVKRLPRLLRSLRPREPGASANADRYAILDLSFDWSAGLTLPDYFTFGSDDSRLRITWEQRPMEPDDFDWSSRFSFPPEQTPRVIIDETPARRGQRYCSPHLRQSSPRDVDVNTRVVEVSNYQGEKRLLTCALARTRLQRGTLQLEYTDDRALSPTLEAFEFALESLTPER
jgi:hypothetical protein